MTKREIFYKVYTHLLKQKEKCHIDNTTTTGNKTNYVIIEKDGVILKDPAGILISEEIFIKNKKEILTFDCYADDGNELGEMLLDSGIKKDDLVFVENLQDIHDNYTVEKWKIQLENFAKTNNIKLYDEHKEYMKKARLIRELGDKIL